MWLVTAPANRRTIRRSFLIIAAGPSCPWAEWIWVTKVLPWDCSSKPSTNALGGHGRADGETRWGASVFLQLINPKQFGGREAFLRETSFFAQFCAETPVPAGKPPVRLPGHGRARASRQDQTRPRRPVASHLLPAADSRGGIFESEISCGSLEHPRETEAQRSLTCIRNTILQLHARTDKGFGLRWQPAEGEAQRRWSAAAAPLSVLPVASKSGVAPVLRDSRRSPKSLVAPKAALGSIRGSISAHGRGLAGTNSNSSGPSRVRICRRSKSFERRRIITLSLITDRLIAAGGGSGAGRRSRPRCWPKPSGRVVNPVFTVGQSARGRAAGQSRRPA